MKKWENKKEKKKRKLRWKEMKKFRELKTKERICDDEKQYLKLVGVLLKKKNTKETGR